jgi:lipoprotein-anchoring transpeptidase ErfK/SrfK
VDALLDSSRAPAAARVLLGSPDALRSSPALRQRALRAADALCAPTPGAGDAATVDALLQARRLYAQVYDTDGAPAAERERAFEGSRALFETLVRGNGAPETLVLRHVVQPGESVWALSRGAWRKAGASVAPGFVLHVNGVSDARRVRAGQTLRVPLEPLTLLVRKSSFELTVLLGGAPVERFPVAVGAGASTPSGVFQVSDCLKNPVWYFNGRRIPFGDPENIIGTRWVGLTGDVQAEGIGIHGTSDADSIGQAVSLGCVRLRNADVERLFEWVGTGTRVEVRD